MRRIVALTTDFGTADGYVGEMKGLLFSLAPDIEIVDVTHDIPPQDVLAGRIVVDRVWRRFPRETIHVVVVDPGVGSPRAALAVESDGQFLVGPDNGVLSPALGDARVVTLPIPASVSSTFHGRDVFAPAAAALARGEALESLGVRAAHPLVLRIAEPRRDVDGSTEGEVIHVDRFGNAVTNLRGAVDGSIVLGATTIRVGRTYADVRDREPIALTGSSGLLEIAVRNSSAARELGISRGDKVLLRPNS